MILFLLLAPTLHTQAQENISERLAKLVIERLYKDLDTFAHEAFKHNVKDEYSYADTKRKEIINSVDSNCLITNDITRIDKDGAPGDIHFMSYVNNNLYNAAKKYELKFVVNCSNMKYDQDSGRAEKVILKVTAVKNSYQCTAEIRFKGEKIIHIKYSDFKPIENTNDNIHVPTPKRIGVAQDPYMNFSAGYGWQGIHLGVGTGGLSDNWFFSRVKIGMEMNMKRSNYEHYPTSSEGLPATKTYHQNKYDVAGGLQIGYMIIPGRETEWDIEEGLSLSALLGFGGIFYDWWSEKTEQSSIIIHGPSQAFYIKPSLRFDWAYWGIEAGYYFSPKESPIRGTTFRLIINIPL